MLNFFFTQINLLHIMSNTKLIISFEVNENFNVKRDIIKSNLLMAFLITKNKTIRKMKLAKYCINKINNKNMPTYLIIIFI